MKEVVIFGKRHAVVERRSNCGSVRRKNGQVIVFHSSESPRALLKNFLADELYRELNRIYGQIKRQGQVELFGDLDFEVVGNIDKKQKRVAKLSGRKVFVKRNAVALKRSALKYIIVHEIAHTLTKKHTDKFWKVVRTIYPGFELGKKQFTEFRPMAAALDFGSGGG